MKRVIILGNNGSGKSTFSNKLGKVLNLPVIHLDKLFHMPNWENPKPEEWDIILNKLVAEKYWIIDGTYRRTLQQRIKAADTIFFIDTPIWMCLYRAIKRRLIYRNKSRPDLPSYLKEKISFAFIIKILSFSRSSVLKQVSKSGKKVIILKPSEIENYLNRI